MPEEYMKCYDRIMTPAGTFKKISRWTSSASIECEDGKLLEEKLNDISGITSDLNCADEKIAASAKAANTLYKSTISLNGKVSECFQSVSDGKKLLAAAITDKGINTVATDDFSKMAQNIKGLITMSSDPNVLFNNMSWTAPKNCIAVMSFTFTMDCNSDYKQTARISLSNTSGNFDFDWGDQSSSDAGWHSRGTTGNLTWEAHAGVTYSLSIDPFYRTERAKGNIMSQHWTSTWIVPKR